MRRALIVITILFVCTNHLSAQVNKGMPDIKDVVLAFFSTYDKASLTQDGYIKFEKKEKGWYINKIKFENMQPAFSSLLFWNKQKQQFEALPFEHCINPETAGSEENLKEYNDASYLQEYDYYGYRRNLYYGYDGWDWDVIKYADTHDLTTDTLTETFARACNSYAITYFYDQFGAFITNDDPDRTRLKEYESIPPARVKKFIIYENKAIDAYKRLAKLNPQYSTSLGDINWRIANEQFLAYSTLFFLGYEPDGKQFLNAINMPDSIIQKGKDILSEVTPNSILFLSGDAPTYAVWYLQSQGFRKDVIAINQEMLGLRRIVSYLDNKYKHTLFSADTSVYMNKNFDYALYNKDYANNDTIRLDSFLIQLYNSPHLTKLSKGNATTFFTDDKTFKFFTKNIYINVDTKKVADFFTTSNKQQKIYPCISKDYLFISDMLVFDIINNNFLKRHLFFSYPPEDPCYLKYLIAGQYVYEFTSLEQATE